MIDVRDAMQTVVDYLDQQMQTSPNRELANTSNFLQAILDKEDEAQ